MMTWTVAPLAICEPCWPDTSYFENPVWNRSVSSTSSGLTATSVESTTPAGRRSPAAIAWSVWNAVPALTVVLYMATGMPFGNTLAGTM
ncbi:hypothetical protein D3C85_1437350 [compost metagenome]